MIELDTLYNEECLEGMKRIPDESIDAIICDLPYGTMVRSSYGSMEEQFKAFREWDYANALEWFMLDYPNHYQMRQYVAALNRYYLDTPELWTYDFDPKGFEWILADEAEKNVVAYRRLTDKSQIIVAINFSGSNQEITVPLKSGRPLKVEFSTAPDSDGTDITYSKNNGSYYAKLTIPAFSGKIYKQIPKSKKISL